MDIRLIFLNRKQVIDRSSDAEGEASPAMVDRMKAVRLVCSEVRTLRLGCESYED